MLETSERANLEARTLGASVAMVAITLCACAGFLFASLHHWFHVLEAYVFVVVNLALGAWIGRLSFRLLSRPKRNATSKDRPDWAALVCAAVLALSAMVFARLLFTHDLVRTMDYQLSSPDNDD